MRGWARFKLLRRSTYEAIGTHRRLAMEVVDDMKLGKVGEAGRIPVRRGEGVRRRGRAVALGVGSIVRGTTKNFFASAEFRLRAGEFCRSVMLLTSCVLPFAALPVVRGWALAFGGLRRELCDDSGGGVHGNGRVAGVCIDGSDRSADFLLDADAVNHCDALEWRGYVARNVLCAGGIEARGGVRRCASRGGAAAGARLFEEGVADVDHVDVNAGVERVAVGVRDVLELVAESPGARARRIVEL